MEFENLDAAYEEINEINNVETVNIYDWIEEISKNSEIRYNVPGVERAVVTGDPEMIASRLDSVQGDEIEGARGTCGLTSIANICSMNGMDVTEGMVVSFALENGLCTCDPWSEADTGGITGEQAVEILDAFNIGAHVETAAQCDLEDLAEAVESGRGVIVSVDAGGLWDEPSGTQMIYGMPVANHYITVTGTARDADTGEISGFYICDSGRMLQSDACRYVPVEQFSKVYNSSVYSADAVITDESVRIC